MDNKQDVSGNYNIKNGIEKVICTNEYGFLTDDFSSEVDFSAHTLKNKWYEKIKDYKSDYKKYTKSSSVLKLIRIGIPIPLKYTVWKIFVNRGFSYEYDLLKSIRTEYDHQIYVDVQRTFRTHYLFYKPYGRGQSELFNVLTAFANFMPSVGYCQGMSNIAGILLMYFPEKKLLK